MGNLNKTLNKVNSNVNFFKSRGELAMTAFSANILFHLTTIFLKSYVQKFHVLVLIFKIVASLYLRVCEVLPSRGCLVDITYAEWVDMDLAQVFKITFISLSVLITAQHSPLEYRFFRPALLSLC